MHRIQPRRVSLNFSGPFPKYWSGTFFKTHLLNSFTVVFPDLERFAIYAMRDLSRFRLEENLAADVRGFIAQEALHSGAHQKFWTTLSEQGFRYDSLLRGNAFFLKRFKRYFSAPLNLAIVAGTEHLTELLSEMALEKGYLTGAHPELRRLFQWHAAEEIEHKAVVFDAFQATNGKYWLRTLGFFIATAYLFPFLISGLAMLAAQDRTLLNRSFWSEGFTFFFVKEKFLRRLVAHFLAYLRPSFHPWDLDNREIARKLLAGW